jgi:hypothetical protein
MKIFSFDQNDADPKWANTPPRDQPRDHMRWNPDAIAPPHGDVYEREGDGSTAGYIAAIVAGISLALILIVGEIVQVQGTLFGLPIR